MENMTLEEFIALLTFACNEETKKLPVHIVCEGITYTEVDITLHKDNIELNID